MLSNARNMEMSTSPATCLRNAQRHKLQDGELFEKLSLSRGGEDFGSQRGRGTGAGALKAK